MTTFIAKFTRMAKNIELFSTNIQPLLQPFSFYMLMPLANSIFPIWCVLASSMYSTKVDMLIRDIFIMTSAIIISTMDIHRIHTNNIAIMLITRRLYVKYLIAFFLQQLSTIIVILIFMKDIKKMKYMR